MKTFLCRAKTSLLLSAAAAWSLSQGAALAVSFSVTPSVISNTYSGLITLNIGGLTNGEPVAIVKSIDANADGVWDLFEPVADAFRITDGGATVIGGVTNLNVPYDGNPAAGAITTTLNITPPRSLGNLVGQFVFTLSSPGNHFSPMSATLKITNAALSQSVSGVVYGDGTTPLPYAVVAVLGASSGGNDGGRWVTGVMTDNTGHYRVNLAPGSYMVLPTSFGYYADLSLAAQVTLTNGMAVTNDLFLTSASATISGNVYNAGNSNGVPGIMMPIEGEGYFAICFTDTNGGFTVGVAPGTWKVKVDSEMVIERGFVVPENDTYVDTTTGSVINVNLALWKANALFYGVLTNSAGAPLANVGLSADDQANQYSASGITDANGRFCVGVLGGIGDWHCGIDTSDPALAGYIVSQNSGTNIAVGQAVAFYLSALPATARITGQVRDTFGNPVAGLGIMASTLIGGTGYSDYSETDASGNYSLSAAAGVWYVSPNCCGDNGLDHFGLADPLPHPVTIPPTNVVLNLTLHPYGTPGLFSGQRFGSSGFAFLLNGAPGINYTIQATTNLASGNWFTIAVTNLTESYAVFQDNQATNRQRFYRALMGP